MHQMVVYNLFGNWFAVLEAAILPPLEAHYSWSWPPGSGFRHAVHRLGIVHSLTILPKKWVSDVDMEASLSLGPGCRSAKPFLSHRRVDSHLNL